MSLVVGDHLDGPRQRDRDGEDYTKAHRSPTVTDKTEEAFLSPGESGLHKRYKVDYPQHDDTHVLLGDVKGWFAKQRRK